MELRSELCRWTKTILTRGSEFLMTWASWSRNWTTTIRKPPICSSEKMRCKRMYLILRVDQRLKQNHNNEILPAHPQKLSLLERELGLMLNQETVALRLSSVEEIDPSSSSWKSTSRQWWSDWLLEIISFIVFRTILCILDIGLMKVEEQHGKRMRKQEKISVLYWFFRTNSVPPSSSRSFRTQSYWSFITRQCHYSGRLLQVHWSRRMCNQFAFHDQFRIDTKRTNLSNRQTVFFVPVDLVNKEHKDLDTIQLEAPRLAQYMHKAWKKHQNTVYWVDIDLALKKGLKFYQTRTNDIILNETLPAYCIPTVVRMETGEIICEKYFRQLGLLQRFPWNMTGWKNWVQKLLDNQKEKSSKQFPIKPTESKPRTW